MLEFFSCMYQLRLITHLLQGPAETLLLYISIVGTCFFSCIVLTFKSFANISFKVRQLFKGGNYSREETIKYQEVQTAETIQGRKLFKGGNYSRKYGMQCLLKVTSPISIIFLLRKQFFEKNISPVFLIDHFLYRISANSFRP